MSSHNGGRSPKDLRHLLSLAQEDDSFFPEEMKENLAKLKTLPEEELTENAMLRGRIEQQSELICILKRQADTSLNKLLNCEKEMDELQREKEEYECDYKEQVRKNEVLQKRFDLLFYNHEEIIKIKDDYKKVNDELRKENKVLRNAKCEEESVIVKKKDSEIEELRQRVVALEKESENYKEELRNSLQKVASCETSSCELLEKSKIQTRDAEHKAEEIKKREKLVSSQLLANEKEVKRLETENEKYVQAATEEKQKADEYQKKISVLLEQVKALELSLKIQAETFKKDFEEASANAQVRKLTTALNNAEDRVKNHDKEFTAYKLHVDKLLSKERELNYKLRQLIG